MPVGISHNFTVLIISKAGAAPCFQMPHRHRSFYTVLAKNVLLYSVNTAVIKELRSSLNALASTVFG